MAPQPALQHLLRPPAYVRDLDIAMSTVEDLVLRRALATDRTSVNRIAREIAVSRDIVHEAFEDLKNRKFLDVIRLEGDDYHFTLTTLGHQRAERSHTRCAYSSIAPVSYDHYCQVVRHLRSNGHTTPSRMRQAFGELVVDDALLDRIGPAFNAQQSVFLYGPAGTGKSSIAERLIDLYDDLVVIPHAIEVDGQIITVFDPTIHRPAANQPSHVDPRWVLCERPIVVAGGELELSMLQLKRDPVSNVYAAPLQMKANNGILMIDDFGRQLIQPDALLNRWIVPLERKVDYLSLDSGMKFSVPFELFVVFSTNIDPSRLGDEAFFRRIQNKVYVGPIRADEFDRILDLAASRHQVRLAADAHEMVRAVCRELGRDELVASYPGELCRLVASICDYRSQPRHLDHDTIWAAAELYFTTGNRNERGLNGIGRNETMAGLAGLAGLGVGTPEGAAAIPFVRR